MTSTAQKGAAAPIAAPQEKSTPDSRGGFWQRLIHPWRGSLASEQQLLLVLSLVIGALTGLAVVGFILLTERVGLRLYPVNSPAWRRVLFPILGSLSMGYVLFRYFPGARGSGVSQTKAAMFAGGVIDLRSLIGKFVCTSVTLASGIPLGPEGPSIYVGAGIASVLGRRLRLRPETVKALIPVGAAAAIAAAFNTPLAAVLFALEEIVGDMNAPVLGSIVIASAASWMVLRLLLGDSPIFQVPSFELVHPLVEFGVYAVLGVAGGLVSVAFTKLLLRLRERLRRTPIAGTWFLPVVGGLLAAAIGWPVPQVLGVGYGYVHLALNGMMALRLMALLVLLKVVGTTTSYASGNAGGIFAPTLFIGAMLGGAVGGVAHILLPNHTATAGAYALVGMGAAFAGIVRAPMTSVVLIFEISRNYAVIVPLMIANLVSLFISSRLQPQPIYEALAVQDGVHLPSSERRHDGQRRVIQVMRSANELLPAQMTVRKALEQAAASDVHAWPVMDTEGVVGVIGFLQLEQAAADGKQDQPLAEIIDTREFPHLHADHPLHIAIERMGHAKLDVLPVVSRANIHELFGVATLPDVFSSYGIAQHKSG